MILLTVIAVGLLTLSTISLRSLSQTAAGAEARANARMALMFAINELQKNTGPDTRITAPSSLIDPASPPLVGAWKSWEGTDHDGQGRPIPPDYAVKTKPNSSNGRFLLWLVSGAEQGNAPTDLANLVSKAPKTGTIPLLSSGTLGSGNDREVHLVPQRMNPNPNATRSSPSGHFAWWISGENQKAHLAQPYKPRTDDVAGLVEMGQSHTVTNPEVFGLSSLLTDPEPHHPSLAATKPGRKAVSRQTMAVIQANNPTEPQKKFHDLSSYSVGLLTNTATGGWRKDLSLLTEKWDAIYSSYSGGKLPLFRYAPTAGATSQVAKPTVNNYAPPMSNLNLYPWSEYSVISGAPPPNNRWPANFHAASASWQSLADFATSYKRQSSVGGVAESPFVWDIMSKTQWGGATPTNEQFYNHKHKYRLVPQIARCQFIVYAQARENPVGKVPKRYQLHIEYVPIVTLWNPYNIRLTINNPGVPTSRVVVGGKRGLPGALAIVNQTTYPNPDAVPGSQYKLLSNGNFQYLDDSRNFNNEYDVNIRQNIDRFGATPTSTAANSWVDMRTWGANLPLGQLVFEPGEVIMYSPDGPIEVRFGTTGYSMQKGYRPDAVNGREINVAGNLTSDQKYWFLFRTDKYTQPFKYRPPGVGFSLSYGLMFGASYTGGQLYSGIENDYHNITAISNGDLAESYWPSDEVDEIGYSIGELASGPPVPLFSISLGPRFTLGTGVGTEQNRATKGLVQNDPLASITISDANNANNKDHPANGTFDMTYHSLQPGSLITPNESTSKGFIATGYSSGDGLSRLIMCDIPLRPMASMVELMGWNPRGNNPYPPFQHNLIGNSDATPLIPKDQIVPPVLTPPTVETNLQHDDAYCSNHLLFDDWFLSSIAPEPQAFGLGNPKDINTVYKEFLKGDRELVNRPYRPIAADSMVTDAVATTRIGEMITSKDGWLKVASRLEVEGMFNVNSTSVEAWKALLGHAKSLDKIAMHGADKIVATAAANKHVVTRGAIATDVEAGSGPGFGGQFATASEYAGYRTLSDAQIEDLAEKVVEQVRLRGPFLSLSEFINRQLSTNKDLALAGAIQSALNNLSADPMAVVRNPANSLSDTTMLPTDPKLAGVDYKFPESAAGSSAYGVPGWIRQADILRPIAPTLSVRDDTFTIRAYGDSLDKSGKVIAKAWCEAIVKRTRDFSDRSDPPDSIDPPASKANLTFGRRFEIISFRWLTSNEV